MRQSRQFLLLALLLMTSLPLVHAQETPSPTPSPTTPTPTPSPSISASASTAAAAPESDTEKPDTEKPESTTDPKAEGTNEDDGFNFWHRIFSPIVGAILVALVVIIALIYWRKRRQAAFVEAIQDNQAFRDEEI